MVAGRFACLLICIGLSILAAAKCTHAITIVTVPVANPGNAADSTGFGAVDYNYNIGKFEVTVGQYTAFLNAVASTDTYGFYTTKMTFSGISQIGDSGSYSYDVTGSSILPVAWVSWGDAARFCNWLSNGQPSGF